MLSDKLLKRTCVISNDNDIIINMIHNVIIILLKLKNYFSDFILLKLKNYFNDFSLTHVIFVSKFLSHFMV